MYPEFTTKGEFEGPCLGEIPRHIKKKKPRCTASGRVEHPPCSRDVF